MRISHSQLENCRFSPRRWAQERVTGAFDARFGFNRALKLAIYRYHGTNDAHAALGHLRHLLRNFSNEQRKIEIEHLFVEYTHWAANSKLVVGDSGIRLDLDIGYGFVLGGEVNRLDIISSGGYRAILLEDPEPDWINTLRMPLIQLGLANKYDRDVTEISVGFQDIVHNNLVTKQYTSHAINRALAEARQLTRVLAQEVGRLRTRT